MKVTELIRRTAAGTIRLTVHGALTCHHHWHVRENGWRCCWCPAKLGRHAVPPRNLRTDCHAPAPTGDLDSPGAYLPPPRSISTRTAA